MAETIIQDPLLDELGHLFSERARTGETTILNVGPQHPSTHGVLRLIVELDGERVINVVPDIGFLHTGVEKNMEAKTYAQAEVMVDRLDYLNPMGNNLTYCLAVEKLVGLDVPPRAQVLRVILAELQRLASHLVLIGTSVLDLGATSLFLYAFRDRESILDIFEMVSGARMMTTYIRPGGLWRDVPPDFVDAVRNVLKVLPGRIKSYEDLILANPLFQDRTRKIGVVSKEDAAAWGLLGPNARASGIARDVRKVHPYSGYEQYDFDVPVATEGDVYSRFWVRFMEMHQSLRIIEQALKILPSGPVRSDNRKFVPPPRSEIGVSMESLIHHFKLWTEGFSAPKESVYVSTESPRGELGVYLEGDGGPHPYRVHLRTPSYTAVQAMPLMMRNYLMADLIAIIGSTDIVLGDVDR